MEYPNGSYSAPEEQSFQTTESVGTYTAKTFLWMFGGLMFTFLVAMAIYLTDTVYYIFRIPYFHWILLAAELVVVIYLSARIEKMSVGAARTLFFGYALLNGIVFSTFFFIFAVDQLIYVFAITAAYFGIMAGVGYFTKMDLSRWRPILFSGLIFLVLFWICSYFLPLGQFERIICIVGVAIFLGFTAYDTQKIRAYHAHYSNNQAMLAKASIFSALQLYLDFINMFLYVLRLVAGRD